MSNDEPKSLRDVARAALDRHKGVSGRQLAEIARGKGLTIVSTTINHMAAGTYTSRPTAKTLDALAELSGLSREVVYRVADQPLALAPLRDALPPDADLLDGPQREAVLAVIRQFAAAQRALHGSEEVGSDAGSSAANQTGAGDLDNNPENVVTLRPEPTADDVVQRYLDLADGDAGEAGGLLSHDGPKGAQVPEGVWEAALGELGRLRDVERGPAEPGQQAARGSSQPPLADEERRRQDEDAESGDDEPEGEA